MTLWVTPALIASSTWVNPAFRRASRTITAADSGLVDTFVTIAHRTCGPFSMLLIDDAPVRARIRAYSTLVIKDDRPPTTTPSPRARQPCREYVSNPPEPALALTLHSCNLVIIPRQQGRWGERAGKLLLLLEVESVEARDRYSPRLRGGWQLAGVTARGSDSCGRLGW